MMKHIYDKSGLKFIRSEESLPVCSEDFCDCCGDCLRCYWENECLANGTGAHSWVQYGEDEDGTKTT